jgi:hypothetical protein
VDVVIEVRDTSIPYATTHPSVPKWIGNKPLIIVIARLDLPGVTRHDGCRIGPSVDKFESVENNNNHAMSDNTDDDQRNNADEDQEDGDIYDPALHSQQQKLLMKNHPPLLIILDLASLETVKTKKGDFQLLNYDDHIGLIS